MRIDVFLFFALSFAPTNSSVSPFSTSFLPLKDPTTAVIFSSISPGLGHVYAGKPVKGIAIWSVETVIMYLGLSQIAEIRFGITGSVGPSFTISVKKNPKPDEILKAGLYGVGFLAVYVYSLIDSRNCVVEYNRRVLNSWKRRGVPLLMLEF